MQSHARWVHGDSLAASLHSARSLTSLLPSIRPSVQALCDALKKWQDSGDISGKRRRNRSSSERCYIDFHFEQGEQARFTLRCSVKPAPKWRYLSGLLLLLLRPQQVRSSSRRGCSSWRTTGATAGCASTWRRRCRRSSPSTSRRLKSGPR